MRKLYCTIFAASLFCFNSYAQISAGGEPVSFSKKTLSENFEVKSMPMLDIAAIEAAESARGDEPRPYKFGELIPVTISLENSGTWEELRYGRLWRVGIKAEGAFTLNFIFNQFYIPEGGKFFIYNSEKDYILGAFTSFNNRDDARFATDIVKGEMAVLEYYEPNDVRGQGKIQLETVTHGYKDLFHVLDGNSPLGSGSCNNDINCPEWTDWQDDKRAVGIMLSGGNGFCTGTMVVDVPQSGTPYFLSANHCMGGNPSNWVFRFNYEHITCNQSAVPTPQSISGATLRANWSTSDFALLQLNNTPPANYNVYYAGWTNDGLAATQATGIHHPSGDVKKISRENSTLTSSGWGGPGNSHWQNPGWDDGVTEGGSSGSGLWDQNHRLVGQLHGGASACGNPANQLWDQYGKFSVSWNGNNTNSTRLKNWLDPNSTGAVTADGWDPNVPALAFDAKINTIVTPVNGETFCGTAITPIVIIKNSGTTTLTDIDISYNFDGGATSVYNWNGSLATNATDTVTLPLSNLAEGSHTFTASTSIVGNADQNPTNDTLSSDFSNLINGNTLTITMNTDGEGGETTWDIKDSTGAVIYAGGPYGNNQTIVSRICVPEDACYTFTVYDSFGDGMCCTEGNGSFTLDDENDYHIAWGGQFGSQQSIQFCLPIVPEPPVAEFTVNDQEICEGETITFVNQSVASTQMNYNWAFGGGTPSSSIVENPVITFNNQGVYAVRLICSNQFGVDTFQVNSFITVFDSPILSITSTVDHVGGPPDGTASVTVNGGTPPYTYSWSNGESSTSSTTTNTITDLSSANYTVEVTDASGCSASQSILVGTNTGVEEEELENLIRIYPNPTKDFVTVELPSGKNAESSQLFNIIGSKIDEHTVNGKQRFSVDLSDFAKGIYLLRISVDGQIFTKKITLSK